MLHTLMRENAHYELFKKVVQNNVNFFRKHLTQNTNETVMRSKVTCLKNLQIKIEKNTAPIYRKISPLNPQFLLAFTFFADYFLSC